MSTGYSNDSILIGNLRLRPEYIFNRRAILSSCALSSHSNVTINPSVLILPPNLVIRSTHPLVDADPFLELNLDMIDAVIIIVICVD